MNEFTLTITEKHLDLAIKAETQEKDTSRNKRCILAQAAKEFLPDFNSCGYTSITTTDYEHYEQKRVSIDDPNVFSLVYDFDHQEYESVRRKLPVTVHFVRELTQ